MRLEIHYPGRGAEAVPPFISETSLRFTIGDLYVVYLDGWDSTSVKYVVSSVEFVNNEGELSQVVHLEDT